MINYLSIINRFTFVKQMQCEYPSLMVRYTVLTGNRGLFASLYDVTPQKHGFFIDTVVNTLNLATDKLQCVFCEVTIEVSNAI